MYYRSLQLSSVISINTTHPLKVLVYTEACGRPDNRPVFWFRFPIKSCHFKSVSGRKFFAVIQLFLPAPPWFNSRGYKRAAETFTRRLISERRCEDTGCNPSVNGLWGGEPLRGCCRRSIYPRLVYSGGHWKTHSKQTPECLQWPPKKTICFLNNWTRIICIMWGSTVLNSLSEEFNKMYRGPLCSQKSATVILWFNIAQKRFYIPRPYHTSMILLMLKRSYSNEFRGLRGSI